MSEMSMPPFLKFVIPGNPLAWSRAVPLHKGRAFDKQKKAKFDFGLILISQLNGLSRPVYSGALEMDIKFFFEPAQYKKSEPNIAFHKSPPDLSNLIKFIEDASAKILYPNDCMIASLKAAKYYDPEPRTEFVITELK
jgi:Holliday junction resolvase RusA-like endonuclease